MQAKQRSFRTLRNRAFAMVIATVAAGAVQAETLGSALTGAYTNSGLIEQNRAVLRAADEGVAEALARLRPVVDWSTTVSRTFSEGEFPSGAPDNRITQQLNTQIVVQQTLWAGGANRLRVESAKASVLATRASLVSIEQQVLLRGVQAFMEMRRAIEQVALRENNVRVIGEELRAARDRFEVGEVTRTDVALAEARLASAQSALAGAQGSLAIAREEYRFAIGRAPVSPVAPSTLPSLPGSIDGAKALAFQNHPDIVNAQRQVQLAELGVQIAQSSLKPSVTARGSYGLTDDLDSGAYSLGGRLSVDATVPLYAGGGLSSAVRQARARADEARASLHLAHLSVGQAVGNAYAQLRVARATSEAVRAEVAAATVAFRGVREEATLGARTTLDVLDAEQDLLDARARQVSAQVDETIAAYAVLSAIGRLTAADLGLPVPTFDPEAYYNMVRTAPAGLSPQGRELDRVLRALGKE